MVKVDNVVKVVKVASLVRLVKFVSWLVKLASELLVGWFASSFVS